MNIFPQNFWLNIDKPADYSSAKVVSIVKRITKAKKVGHSGTLDPFATGVLPIAVGKATKTCSYITDAVKKYYFEIAWGEFRDSDDITGNVIETSDSRPNSTEISNILPKFIGKIRQIPSSFSAIKVDGKRSYDLARQGILVELKSREIEISSLKLISNNHKFAAFEVVCSKGTYIRSLAKDLSKELKVCGYVAVLKRLQVGSFLIEKTISLAKLKNIFNYNHPSNFLLPLSDVLNFIPEIELNNSDVLKIKNGQFVELSSPLEISQVSQKTVKIINNGDLTALATLENGVLKPLNNF